MRRSWLLRSALSSPRGVARFAPSSEGRWPLASRIFDWALFARRSLASFTVASVSRMAATWCSGVWPWPSGAFGSAFSASSSLTTSRAASPSAPRRSAAATPATAKKAKAKLKLNEATIHDDCVKDLQAYAPNGPRPWKLEGKCFRTGYSKHHATEVAESFTPFLIRLCTRVFASATKRKDKKEGKAERKGDARGGRDASIAPNAAPPG